MIMCKFWWHFAVDGKVRLVRHPGDDPKTTNLWSFVPIDINNKKYAASQGRILVTDKYRGQNYPKPFTTYQIVSVENDNICLGVKYPSQVIDEYDCLRVCTCYKDRGKYTWIELKKAMKHLKE